MIARKISCFFIIALLLVIVKPSYAQQQSKGEELSDQQAETYASLIFEEKISVEDTHKLRESLSKENVDKISKKLEKKLIEKKNKAPKEPEVPTLTPEEEKTFLPSVSDVDTSDYTILNTGAGCDPGEPVFCWRQPVDNGGGGAYQSPQLATGYYNTTNTCDKDEPDTDMVLAYQYNHYSNPDSLLWVTNSNSIAWYIDNSLNTYGINANYDVRMCINNAVTFMHSYQYIRDHMYIVRRITG